MEGRSFYFIGGLKNYPMVRGFCKYLNMPRENLGKLILDTACVENLRSNLPVLDLFEMLVNRAIFKYLLVFCALSGGVIYNSTTRGIRQFYWRSQRNKQDYR